MAEGDEVLTIYWHGGACGQWKNIIPNDYYWVLVDLISLCAAMPANFLPVSAIQCLAHFHIDNSAEEEDILPTVVDDSGTPVEDLK